MNLYRRYLFIIIINQFEIIKSLHQQSPSGDGETSQSIRQSPAWQGGWRGNLANGGETGETKKPDISYSKLFRTKKTVS